jgi:hypothetical protein
VRKTLESRFAPVAVGYHQQSSQRIDTQCDKAFFVVISVFDSDRQRIVENRFDFGEPNPGVFALVAAVLGCVESDAHEWIICI